MEERFGRRTPRFVVGWMRRFFHEDFMNEFLRRGLSGVEFCTEATKYLGLNVSVEGLDCIQCMGREQDSVEDSSAVGGELARVAGEGEKLYTFVSNHPLGGADGVVLMGILGRKYGGRVRTMVNDFLMNLKGFAPLCVPVNKMGGQAAELPRLTEEMFASENQVLMFPAGKCSRRIHGKVQDVAWSKTFIDKSVRHHRDIVPIRFIGQNSKRFYLIAQLTKKMKFNVAMAFLPDEMYRARGKSFRIVFGSPIPWQHFDASRSKREWAQWVRGEVYKLN